MNYLEANLASLGARQPALAAQLRKTPGKCVNVTSSACGLPTACYKRKASPLALHSRYDPMREARNALKNFDCAGADYYVFLGFGLGYLLDALLEEHSNPSNHYFIVESDLEIIRAAMEARDLSDILSLPQIHFAWPPSGPALGEQWQNFFDPIQAKKSVFLNHSPSIAINAGLFKSAAETIHSQVCRIFTDINTLVAKSQNFLDNFVQNLPKAARAPGISHFAGLFPDLPAVIVSAGPSLDKNIHELRGHEDQVLILSTDTALKPLQASGIHPHFVLTGDPSALNYRHLQGTPIQDAFLVAEATSFPAVFEEFEKKIIACTFENSSLRSLSELLGNKGTLRAWGSVATMALDFALSLRCNPIIFIGQDLAHTDGRIYCSGLCFDKEWFAGMSDPVDWGARVAQLRSARRTLIMEDILGRPIETTDKLAAYWNWIQKVFSEHPETRFINATEGGILKGNLEILSLRETLYRYCGPRLDHQARIRDTYEAAQQNNLLYASVNLSTLKGEMAAIQDILNQGSRICDMSETMSSETLLKRLEDTKQSIYCQPHLAPLLDCFNQMGNYAFLRKRHTIHSTPMNVGLKDEIRGAYLEFFLSVRNASSLIDQALHRIEAELKF